MPESHEMPRYRSHKEVRALEIAKVERVGVDFQIAFADNPLTGSKWAPITVQPTFFARGTAQPGDFYVVYADGYASWSPAKAFLEGYSAAAVVPGNVPAALPGDFLTVRLPVVNGPDEFGDPRVQIRTQGSSTGVRVSRSDIISVERAPANGAA